MRLQSELCWQQLSFIYHWPGNSLPAEHFIQAIYWKNRDMARFQFNSWVCSHPHAAGVGCTMYGYCQAASRRERNGCRQEPGTTQTKGASGSHHNFLLRYANHSWKLSAEWWIFPSAPIRALVSDTWKLSIVLSLMIFSSLTLRLHCHKLVLSNLWPVLSTQLQVPQNSTHPVLLRIRQLSVSLSPSLLHCNSWRQTHIVSVSLNIPWLWFLPFLNPVFFLGVGTNRWRLSA